MSNLGIESSIYARDQLKTSVGSEGRYFRVSVLVSLAIFWGRNSKVFAQKLTLPACDD